jgi:hypothetical protein
VGRAFSQNERKSGRKKERKKEEGRGDAGKIYEVRTGTNV